MKKIFLLFTIFIIAATSVFALSLPRWDKRPIKVYIPTYDDYKYRLMKAAFTEWQDKTYSAVWFVFLGENKKNEADITVNFVDIVTNCNNPSAVGCTHYYVNHQKFYVKSIVDIGSRSLHVLQGDDGTVAKKTVKIPPEQMYGIMLHEIGHAIGITEHSKNANSVMYTYSLYDFKIPQHLTDEDLRLVYKTYR